MCRPKPVTGAVRQLHHLINVGAVWPFSVKRVFVDLQRAVCGVQRCPTHVFGYCKGVRKKDGPVREG